MDGHWHEIMVRLVVSLRIAETPTNNATSAVHYMSLYS